MHTSVTLPQTASRPASSPSLRATPGSAHSTPTLALGPNTDDGQEGAAALQLTPPSATSSSIVGSAIRTIDDGRALRSNSSSPQPCTMAEASPTLMLMPALAGAQGGDTPTLTVRCMALPLLHSPLLTPEGHQADMAALSSVGCSAAWHLLPLNNLLAKCSSSLALRSQLALHAWCCALPRRVARGAHHRCWTLAQPAPVLCMRRGSQPLPSVERLPHCQWMLRWLHHLLTAARFH